MSLDQSVLANAPTILVKVFIYEHLAIIVDVVARVCLCSNHTYILTN